MSGNMEFDRNVASANSPPKLMSLKCQVEHLLQNAVLMTEMGMDLKERSVIGEKYIRHLRNLSLRAGKAMSALQTSGRTFLLLAQKLAISVMCTIDNMPIPDHACYSIKMEYEKLLSVIEKELADGEEADNVENLNIGNYSSVNMTTLIDKIKYLETKQKVFDNALPSSSSMKSMKSDVDEKYPENLSRESLIDLNNVVNLPTVPEDIFTTFSSNKPTRTSSLSSLKSMRRVKLFLQRASSTSDDEDESSEPDEHDFTKSVGDCDDVKLSNTWQVPKKVFLGNIKEETQQD